MGVYDLHTRFGPAKEYLEALNAPKKQILALNTVGISPCARNRAIFGHLGQRGIGGDEVVNDGVWLGKRTSDTTISGKEAANFPNWLFFRYWRYFRSKET